MFINRDRHPATLVLRAAAAFGTIALAVAGCATSQNSAAKAGGGTARSTPADGPSGGIASTAPAAASSQASTSPSPSHRSAHITITPHYVINGERVTIRSEQRGLTRAPSSEHANAQLGEFEVFVDATMAGGADAGHLVCSASDPLVPVEFTSAPVTATVKPGKHTFKIVQKYCADDGKFATATTRGSFETHSSSPHLAVSVTPGTCSAHQTADGLASAVLRVSAPDPGPVRTYVAYVNSAQAAAAAQSVKLGSIPSGTSLTHALSWYAGYTDVSVKVVGSAPGYPDVRTVVMKPHVTDCGAAANH